MQYRTIIVGYGSIAQRHAKNIKALKPDTKIMVLRASEASVSPEIDDTTTDLKTALDWQPHIAIIANPLPLHISVAQAFAEQGAHILIEKPLAMSSNGIDHLIQTVEQKKISALVGYNLRFFEPLQAVKNHIDSGTIGKPLYFRTEVGQYLPDWRPGRDYRTSVSAQKALGGGPVFELSHEIDYARWLMGDVSTVKASLHKVSSLEINVEDLAEIELKFKSGAVGSVHLDFIQRIPRRLCYVVGTHGTIEVDFITGIARLQTVDDEKWRVLVEDKSERNSMYIDELQHFFDCIEQSVSPLISIDDARKTLDVLFAIHDSHKEQKAVSL